MLDEPVKDDALEADLAAIDRFIAAVKASDEEAPEFERVNFGRFVNWA